jgi:threonine/homoserine/homoserine lactone efflux protein
VLLTIALGAVYVVATLGLVVFLEVWPALAAYAPALFPALAVVGALNLVMISRQELREAAVKEQKAEAKARRTSRKTSKTTAQGAQHSLPRWASRTRF